MQDRTTDRTKRGQTRAHWAIQTALATHAFYLELDAQSERAEQEQTLVAGMLVSLASALLEQPQKDLQTQSLELTGLVKMELINRSILTFLLELELELCTLKVLIIHQTTTHRK